MLRIIQAGLCLCKHEEACRVRHCPTSEKIEPLFKRARGLKGLKHRSHIVLILSIPKSVLPGPSREYVLKARSEYLPVQKFKAGRRRFEERPKVDQKRRGSRRPDGGMLI